MGKSENQHPVPGPAKDQGCLNSRQKLVIRLWQHAVNQCSGKMAVKSALLTIPDKTPYAILSIGKAAAAMSLAAHQILGTDIPSLTITKDGHICMPLRQLSDNNPQIELFESAHPVPDKRSLKAGQMARDFVTQIKPGTSLIMLVSGGASALCELLPDGMGLEDLKKLTEEKLATGATISQINKARSEISLIKRGKILNEFKGRGVKAYILSDVAGNEIETIGSGISMYPQTLPEGKFDHEVHILKSNTDARNAVEHMAHELDLQVIENSENLYGDVFDCARLVARSLHQGPDGIYIYGGEPTVELPENPGIGGRAQCLALALAKEIKAKKDITCLVAGTDGTDGPTEYAGGLVDGDIFSPSTEALQALDEANSGDFLRRKGALYITGPTGTNVNDLALCLKLSEDKARLFLERINQ